MKDGVPENEIFARAKELKELEEREREEQAAQQRGGRRNTITAAFGKVSKPYMRTLHLRTLSSVHVLHCTTLVYVTTKHAFYCFTLPSLFVSSSFSSFTKAPTCRPASRARTLTLATLPLLPRSVLTLASAQYHIALTFSTAETRRVYAFEQIVEHDRTGSCVCV
jgi:hypothetical protein